MEAIADLANPLTLGGDYTVLASRAYLAVIGEYDMTGAAVYSLILLVPAVVLYIAQRQWLGRKVRTTITGKPSGSVHLIRGWVRWPLFGLALFISLFIASLYGTVIIGAFTNIFGLDNTFTLDHIREVVLGVGQAAIIDTTTLALIATPIAGSLGMLIGWMVVRHLRRAAGWLDFAGTLGVAVPGTVLGIGYVLAYRQDLYIGPIPVLPGLVGGGAIAGGAFAIVLAYTTRSVPAGLRTATAAMSQLDVHIEEASTGLGAKPFQTFRWVTLPLMRSALLTGSELQLRPEHDVRVDDHSSGHAEHEDHHIADPRRGEHRPLWCRLRLLHSADRYRTGRASRSSDCSSAAARRCTGSLKLQKGANDDGRPGRPRRIPQS